MTISLRACSSVVLGGLVLAAVLTGCATAAGTSPTPESTADPVVADESSAPRAAWLDATSFVIKTWGDACAPQIGDIVAGEQSLDIVLVAGEDEICATVRTAHGTYIGLPAGFDSSRPVELTLTEAGGETTELTLAGLEDGEIQPADRPSAQVPAAAWIEEGELAVLTWGSSTCMPGSGEFDATSEKEGVVRLHSHTDTICTRDLVPQITFVSAEGVAPDEVLTLADHVDADGAPVILRVVR
ncbi:hypothetical protein [Microbacterium sp. MYb66]|uniref:hypothetical protein n=1 Tax=Microbacterium sp. MYb66 TaxID=1848692 RepID=UPI000CFEEE16|nr:hypothetical protein [Microbacterium sp. MYb66]PRA80069.1 hypothetical protein CQ045_13500 [Microbacterium sp. MYb66]